MDASGHALRVAAPASLGERIWLSRSWRLGWAVAVVLMILGQLLAAGAAERSVRRLAHRPLPESAAVRAARELGLEPAGSVRLAGRWPGMSRPDLGSLPLQE